MSSEAEDRIQRSARLFRDIVWPKIKDDIGGGRLISIEDIRNHEFAKVLDVIAGIDSWQVCDSEHRMRGLATRVQEPERVRFFKTFTIRYRKQSGRQTEFHKRLAAMNAQGKWLSPVGFIQAYFHKDKLTAVAAAGVHRILNVIVHGRKGKDWWINTTSREWGQTDETDFAVIPFESIKKMDPDAWSKWWEFPDESNSDQSWPST